MPGRGTKRRNSFPTPRRTPKRRRTARRGSTSSVRSRSSGGSASSPSYRPSERSRVGSLISAMSSDAGLLTGAPNLGRSIGTQLANFWDGPSRPGGSVDITRSAEALPKGSTRRRVRKVRVNPILRKKIKTVMTADKPKGYYQAIHYAQFLQGAAGYQKLERAMSYMNGSVFDGRRLLYIASRLFNNKAPQTADPQYGDTGVFNYRTLQVEVLKNHMLINLKSNSKRQYKMTLFICVPKLMAANASGDPLSHWEGALAELRGAGIVKGGINWSITGVGSGDVQSTWIGQDPRKIKQFNNYWKVSTVDVNLNPGEFTSFTIPLFTGPVDYQKIFKNGATQEFTKLNTHIFWRYATDIVQTQNFGALRASDSAGSAIAAEYILQTEIAMPDQTGFRYDGNVTVNQDLNLRHQAMAYDNFGAQNTAIVPALLRIDPHQPATSIV